VDESECCSYSERTTHIVETKPLERFVEGGLDIAMPIVPDLGPHDQLLARNARLPDRLAEVLLGSRIDEGRVKGPVADVEGLEEPLDNRILALVLAWVRYPSVADAKVDVRDASAVVERKVGDHRRLRGRPISTRGV
jgi:hypothetical protein